MHWKSEIQFTNKNALEASIFTVVIDLTFLRPASNVVADLGVWPRRVLEDIL
jgi:hypothetical protein